MSQDDNQISLKQEIIKAEILDKNYDKDKFLSFILSKKEHGDDLSKWTLLELNNAIVEFTEGEKGVSKKEEAKPQESSDKMTQDINVDIEKLKICKTKEEEKVYEKEIICKKLEKTVLNDKEIVVILRMS